MRKAALRSFLVVALLGPLAVTLPSCKGSDDADADSSAENGVPDKWPDETEEVREAFEPLLDHVCAWQFNCCTEGQREVSLAGAGESRSDCVSRLYELSRQGAYLGQLGALQWLPQFFTYLGYDLDLGRVAINEAALGDCLEALEERECNPKPEAEDHCTPEEPEQLSACAIRKILEGKQEAGEPCQAVGGGVECEPGLVCRQVGNQGACVEGVAEGTPCTDDYQCPEDLICEYESGTCEKGGENGDDCSFFDPELPEPNTEKERCARGYLCDPRTNTCGPQNCTYGTYCQGDSDCPEGLPCVMNICQGPRKLNQTCYSDSYCESGRCDDYYNICIPLSSNGTACASDVDCNSGYCDGVLCRAVKAPDAACSSQNECAGYCDYNALPEAACAAHLAPGADCTLDYECGKGDEAACIDQVCRNLPRDEGQSCLDDFHCATGFCGEESTCEFPGGEGAPCTLDSYQACAEQFYCLTEAGEVEGECAPVLDPGELCSFDEQCPNSDCRLVKGRYRCGEGSSATEAMCDGVDER